MNDNGIFIGYREDDAKAWALLLRDELARAFGGESVFLDLDALQPGARRPQVEAALARSKIALVVIGRRWLAGGVPGGERPADPADDVHGQEVTLALSTAGLTVIPVRVDDAAMPRAEQPGPELRALAGLHSRRIADAAAQRELDLKLLVADAERATGLVARGAAPGLAPASAPSPSVAPSPPPPLPSRKRLLAVAAALGVAFVVAARLTWTTPPDTVESSFLVLLALLLTLGGAWVRDRLARRER